MKRTLRIAVIGIIFAAGLACTHVQATTTNIVYGLTVALTGFQQGTNAALPVAFGNKGILTALDGVLTNPTTHVVVSNHFFDAHGKLANGAKLILDLTLTSGDNLPIAKVRQVFNRTNVVDTDVSPWLVITRQSNGAVKSPAFRYEIIGIALDNGKGTDFSVQGFFTETRGSLIGTGKARGLKATKQTTSAIGAVAGSGDLPKLAKATDTLSILHGTVGAFGATIGLEEPTVIVLP